MQRLRKPSLEPMNAVGPGNDLDLNAFFVEQCSRFERTLSTANHEHLFARKELKVAMLGGVGRERWRNCLKLGGTPSERPDAGGENDASRMNCLPIGSNET